MAEGDEALGCGMPHSPTSLPGAAGLPGTQRRGSGQCQRHAEQQYRGFFIFLLSFLKAGQRSRLPASPAVLSGSE